MKGLHDFGDAEFAVSYEPEDCELVCVLNNKYLTMTRPNVTSYNIPEYDLGAVAMRLLTKMLVDDDSVKDNKDIEMSYVLMSKGTTK